MARVAWLVLFILALPLRYTLLHTYFTFIAREILTSEDHLYPK